MRCAICRRRVQPGEASIATRDGMRVHVACADREATVAWVSRQWWALAQALGVVVAIVALLYVGPQGWLVALIAIGVIAHPLLHLRFWHYLVRDIHTWLRGRR